MKKMEAKLKKISDLDRLMRREIKERKEMKDVVRQ